MPFSETSRLEERVAMLRDYDSGVFSVSELYGVSRPTFYGWLARRSAGDAAWFEDRSRAPLSCPHRTPEAIAAEVVAMKRRFPRFGPKKVRARLQRERPQTAWPAVSTVGGILKRAGLVEPRPRRRRGVELGGAESLAAAPNDEWAATSRGGSAPPTGRAAIR